LENNGKWKTVCGEPDETVDSLLRRDALAPGVVIRAEKQIYISFAYSAFACFKTGMSGSASFQRVRKS